jgi:hypothetical protein
VTNRRLKIRRPRRRSHPHEHAAEIIVNLPNPASRSAVRTRPRSVLPPELLERDAEIAPRPVKSG